MPVRRVLKNAKSVAVLVSLLFNVELSLNVVSTAMNVSKFVQIAFKHAVHAFSNAESILLMLSMRPMHVFWKNVYKSAKNVSRCAMDVLLSAL